MQPTTTLQKESTSQSPSHGSGQAKAAMKISDIMSRDTLTICPEATLQEACEMMREHDIGFLPVSDGEKIRGALTDRDIVTRAIACGQDPCTHPIKHVMSTHIVYIFEDQEILEAARLMEVKKIRRLIVLDRSKNLVGVLSLGDVWSRLKDHGIANEILDEVVQRGEQKKLAEASILSN